MPFELDPLSIHIRSHLHPTPNVKHFLKDRLPVKVLAFLVLDYLQPRHTHFDSKFLIEVFYERTPDGVLNHQVYFEGHRRAVNYIRHKILYPTSTLTCEYQFHGHGLTQAEKIYLNHLYWYCLTRLATTGQRVCFFVNSYSPFDIFSVQQLYEPMKQIKAYMLSHS